MTPTPILDKNELILKYWPELQPGFLDVLQYSNGDDDISRILTDLLTRQMIVWLWFGANDQILGFLTTKVELTRTSIQDKVLIVDHVYIYPDTEPGTLAVKSAKFLQNYAKSLGCVKIKGYSLREEMQGWFKRLGYTPSYQEWVIDVDYLED